MKKSKKLKPIKVRRQTKIKPVQKHEDKRKKEKYKVKVDIEE